VDGTSIFCILLSCASRVVGRCAPHDILQHVCFPKIRFIIEVFERSRTISSALKITVKTSKPGRAYRFRPGIAGVSTRVASFNSDLLIDFFGPRVKC